MIYTGYEIIQFGKGLCAYGFGLLEQRGYITNMPSVEEWQSWDSEKKRQWVVDTNISLSEKVK